MSLWVAASIVFLVNLPFGYLRGGTRRFSLRWLLWIHVPVLGVIALRALAGAGWEWISYPVLVLSFFLGQLGGGRLRKLRAGLPAPLRTLGAPGDSVDTLPLAQSRKK